MTRFVVGAGLDGTSMMDLVNPSSEDVDIRDIARCLSRINRFAGRGYRPYSVAEHSVRMHRMICDGGLRHGPRVRLAALLHDAHEAYTGDVLTPLALSLGVRIALGSKQRLMDRAIAASLGVPCWRDCDQVSEDIQIADGVMLVEEVDHLMGPAARCKWGLPASGGAVRWVAYPACSPGRWEQSWIEHLAVAVRSVGQTAGDWSNHETDL